MATERSNIAGLPLYQSPRPGVVDAVMPDDAHGAQLFQETARLLAELEQARVALEDMDQRTAELVAANAELQVQLTEQTRLRAAADSQVQQLLGKARERKPVPAEDPAIREELSIALEELQVMQEELQAAHEALSRASGQA